MTTKSLQELGKNPDFKMSTDSVTLSARDDKNGKEENIALKHVSGVIKRNGTSVKLGLRDTVGFGANDLKSEDILKKTVLEVADDFEKIRGCILLHKCERYRTGGADDVNAMKHAMKTLGLNFNKHLLLVITHSAHLSKKHQDQYSAEIRAKVSNQISPDRVLHVNFANLAELNEDFRQIFRKHIKSEFEKLLDKLMEFEDPVAPGRREFVEHFEKQHFGNP